MGTCQLLSVLYIRGCVIQCVSDNPANRRGITFYRNRMKSSRNVASRIDLGKSLLYLCSLSPLALVASFIAQLRPTYINNTAICSCPFWYLFMDQFLSGILLSLSHAQHSSHPSCPSFLLPTHLRSSMDHYTSRYWMEDALLLNSFPPTRTCRFRCSSYGTANAQDIRTPAQVNELEDEKCM